MKKGRRRRMDLRDRSNRMTLPGGEAESGAEQSHSPGPPAPRLARGILIATILSYEVNIVFNLLDGGFRGGALAVGLVFLIVICLLQYIHSTPETQRRLGRRKYLTLGVQTALTYLPLMVYGPWWGMTGFLAGSLLLLLPPRSAWPLFGATGVSTFAFSVTHGQTWLNSLYISQTSLLSGIVVFGLSHLSQVIKQLRDTREELARTAVAEERLRFARDLHDLLGYSLSSITLKAELIRRLIPHQPDRAAEEVAEVLIISRQSLADVRSVARGYRDMSLEQEIAAARSVLSAAEVEFDTHISLGKVSPQVDTVLATVLREGITNVLRHSKASRCAITVTQARRGRVQLTLTNNGADPSHRDLSPHSGSGLGNLATRLTAIGGQLNFGHSSHGTFRLKAEAPSEHEGKTASPTAEFVT
ncbi:sensor histidine kinase [Streptomyces gamaensis]|uniref:Sensor histidine kinase n=1 Tax=Streptomyces gamaensis TaxID=1763542 RepID=A0ABW0YTZ2_9ACTN